MPLKYSEMEKETVDLFVAMQHVGSATVTIVQAIYVGLTVHFVIYVGVAMAVARILIVAVQSLAEMHRNAVNVWESLIVVLVTQHAIVQFFEIL